MGYKRVAKPSDEELRRLIVDERMKLSDIGQLYNVRHSTVSNWKAHLGIQQGIIVPFTKVDLISLYSEAGLTECEIAERFNVSQRTVGRYRGLWGIPNLDRKDRQELTNPINLTPFQQDVIRGTMLGGCTFKAS